MGGKIKVKDLRYPFSLREIPDSPEILYYKGNWCPEIFENCLAVVGSRRMTKYGKRVTESIVYDVALQGVTIVSGFMYGVDATAHKAALNAGGKTIAVMPCGIDLIVPDYQDDLYKRILDSGGLVISEMEGDIGPSDWAFPKRNRIVAGLSQAVLVVEGAKRSGSMITANLACKYNRHLFAVPGNINSDVSLGTLSLIKEGKAEMVINSVDVLRFFGVGAVKKIGKRKSKAIKKSIEGEVSIENRILTALAEQSRNIDEIGALLAVKPEDLGQKLTIMQLSGLIYEEGGRFYAN